MVKVARSGRSGIDTDGMDGTVTGLKVGATAAKVRGAKLGGSGISAIVAGTVGGLANVNSAKAILVGATKDGAA